jgi:hypothetical protein
MSFLINNGTNQDGYHPNQDPDHATILSYYILLNTTKYGIQSL